MFGFPYDTADWAVVDGAQFIGWGSALPRLATAIAAILCVAVLVYGQATEAKKTSRFTK